MNSSDTCHQVEGCPGLYVDAFRGHFLREQTKTLDATFILSHYHGDHYTQLPRDYKYRGPAKIHCTPITARLLIDVHLVSKDLVVEHDYGVTFRHRILSKIKDDRCNDTDDKSCYANITFYDANHCPGACIILIALPDGNTVHLHTGDMRYHPRFQKYPLMAQATQERKIDLVYLDTTYCHPKHNFLTQDDAVDTIASQTQELLSNDNASKTLVLLSCYSIGKEKVLYEASKRTGQSIYVSEKKWKMLNCIQQQQKKEKQQTLVAKHQEHMNILDKCTRDPLVSDLHVIPMGLAGEMWPYFQPNYQKLAKYVQDLSTLETADQETTTTTETSIMSPKDYDKVVAFIPTGWADATNWNKKNAVSTKSIQLSESKSLHVEVRLISYSEHSTFPELVNFVQYLKPRKVIPTVYGDANHKRQIEGRFRNMLDSNRAKKAFFRSMTKKKTSSSSTIAEPAENTISSNAKETMLTKIFQNDDTLIKKENSGESKPLKNSKEKGLDDEEIEVVGVVPCKKSPCSSSIDTSTTSSTNKVDTIVSMGFDRKRAECVLEKWQGNLERAIHEILSESTSSNCSGATSEKRANAKDRMGKKALSSHATSATVKKRKISDFFGQRKR